MADPAKRPGYYGSRPRLRIDGREVPDLGDQLLRSVFVEESTLGLFRCEVSFLNFLPGSADVGYVFFDRQVLDFGKTLSVEFGPPTEAGPVFAGRISGIEATFPGGGDREPEFLVLAEDRFQDLRMERHTRTFENVTDEQVFNTVASPHGLTVQVDIKGPTHAILAQVNQSDLAFLRERAAANDAEIWIDNRTLYAQARSRRGSGSIAFTYGDDLLELRATADLAHQRTAVRVSGWDVTQKQAIDVEAGSSVIQGELGNARGGSATLKTALAQHVDRLAFTEPMTTKEAQTLAEARYRRRARSFVRCEGVAVGTPRLRVGTTVELREVGAYFEGSYYVTLARHSFDQVDGYITRFQAERPGIGG